MARVAERLEELGANVFAWWGRTVYRFRYIVIGVMVALCLGGGVYGISLGKHVTQSGFYDDGSQSVHASLARRRGVRPRHVRPHRRDLHRARRQDRRRPGVQEEDPGQPGPGRDRTTPTRSCARSATSRAPDVAEATWPTADKQHAFMSIQLKGDNDDTILNNYKKVAGRLCSDRRRRRPARRPAAAGQRTDRHHRRRPEARRGGRHPAGRGGAVLRLRRRGRRQPARRSSAA